MGQPGCRTGRPAPAYPPFLKRANAYPKEGGKFCLAQLEALAQSSYIRDIALQQILGALRGR